MAYPDRALRNSSFRPRYRSREGGRICRKQGPRGWCLGRGLLHLRPRRPRLLRGRDQESARARRQAQDQSTHLSGQLSCYPFGPLLRTLVPPPLRIGQQGRASRHGPEKSQGMDTGIREGLVWLVREDSGQTRIRLPPRGGRAPQEGGNREQQPLDRRRPSRETALRYRRKAPHAPWQRMYFLPLPQGQGSLRPTRRSSTGARRVSRFSRKRR